MKAKLLFVLAALATFSLASAEENQTKSYWFGGVQGGLQFVATDYNIPDLTMPEFGIQVGRYFEPEFGARLSFQGFQTKGGLHSVNETFAFKHLTSDLDFLFNLSNIFSRQKEHMFNAVFVAGLGVTNAWGNDEIKTWPYKEKNVRAWDGSLITCNFRLGAQLDWNINEHWAANLEVDANAHGDQFNSKRNYSFDWQPTAMVGVNFKFGHKKGGESASAAPVEEEPVPVVEEKPAPAPVAAPEPEPVVAPEPAPKEEPVAAEKIEAAPVTAAPVTSSAQPVATKPFVVRTADDLRVDIFFEKGSAKIDEESDIKLRNLSEWAKSRKVTVTVKGYADKGSGTPEGNKKLSDRRAHQIADEICNRYGFRRQTIQVSSYGDTVQPFEENDKNRVVRIELKEIL